MRQFLCSKCQLIGPTAIDVVNHLLVRMAFSERDTLYLKTYIPGPGIERRLKLDVRSLACLTARQLLARHSRVGSLTKQMLSGLEVDESRGMLPVNAMALSCRLSELVSECKKRKEALALYSICEDSAGNMRHIPMMDFRIESGKDIGQLRLLKECLRELHQTDGVLLNSGKS